MINARELRIGNLVHIEGEIWIVSSIPDDDNYYNDFDPIPLTEEWLLRMGFEVNNTESWYYKGNFRWSKVGRYWLWFGIPMHNDLFKHVHQLQNLYFALTGEELKIDG